MPAPEEIDLNFRAQQGDPPSLWALNEIARLVDKANEAVRENWQLRSQLNPVEPKVVDD